MPHLRRSISTSTFSQASRPGLPLCRASRRWLKVRPSAEEWHAVPHPPERDESVGEAMRPAPSNFCRPEQASATNGSKRKSKDPEDVSSAMHLQGVLLKTSLPNTCFPVARRISIELREQDKCQSRLPLRFAFVLRPFIPYALSAVRREIIEPTASAVGKRLRIQAP